MNSQGGNNRVSHTLWIHSINIVFLASRADLLILYQVLITERRLASLGSLNFKLRYSYRLTLTLNRNAQKRLAESFVKRKSPNVRGL